MHCLNIVRCMIVYLDSINIMRFQKKTLSVLSPEIATGTAARPDLLVADGINNLFIIEL